MKSVGWPHAARGHGLDSATLGYFTHNSTVQTSTEFAKQSKRSSVVSRVAGTVLVK